MQPGFLGRIRLGEYKEESDLLVAFGKKGFSLNETARKCDFSPSSYGREVSLYGIRVSDLGFGDNPPFESVLSRGENNGLSRTTGEAALVLRMKWMTQSEDECVTMAMTPESIDDYGIALGLERTPSGLILIPRVVRPSRSALIARDVVVFMSGVDN